MREIFDELRRAVERRDEGAVATVVGATGSTYRKAGAKVLCLPGGRLHGAVSGGCLETDIYEHAMEVARSSEARRVAYDSHAVNDNVWGLGVGCDGEVDLLIEPLFWWRSARGERILREIDAAFGEGRALVAATIVRTGSFPLDRALLDEKGCVLVGSDRLEIDEALAPALRGAGGGNPVRVPVGEATIDVFVDRLAPPTRLLVFGGGADAVPLVRMAHDLGFRVTIVDRRATPEAFPEADQVVRADADGGAHTLSLGGNPAVVLMTHGYLADLAILRVLLSAPAPLDYIGVLGPRARTKALLEDLAKNDEPDPARVAAIRTPVGLDLGSDTPAEIALAILAEILATRRGRPATPLRDKTRDSGLRRRG